MSAIVFPPDPQARTRRVAPVPILLVSMILLHGCVSTRPAPSPPERPTIGVASWYGQEFAGRSTANGDIFDPRALTAAHRSLPFGTVIDVTNLENGKRVRVRINDRGPFVGNRILDLSWGAAREIDLVDRGIGRVEISVVKVGDNRRDFSRRPPIAAATPKDSTPGSVSSDPAAPPPIAFPLPEELESARRTERTIESTDDVEVEVDAIEVETMRAGVPVRRTVSEDGVTIAETADPEGEVRGTVSRSVEGRPQPSIAPSTTSGSETFVLQLGAFSSRENAERFRDQIAAIIDRIFIEEADAMFRVRSGPYGDRVEAIEARERVEMSGLSAMLLTVR